MIWTAVGMVGVLLASGAAYGAQCQGVDGKWHDYASPECSGAGAQPSAGQAPVDSQCRGNLACWGDRNLAAAAIACVPKIERFAKFVPRWNDASYEPKFSRYLWKDQAAGVVTYLGDKLELQNGFGAWQRYAYHCDFDTSRKTALDVRVFKALPK